MSRDIYSIDGKTLAVKVNPENPNDGFVKLEIAGQKGAVRESFVMTVEEFAMLTRIGNAFLNPVVTFPPTIARRADGARSGRGL